MQEEGRKEEKKEGCMPTSCQLQLPVWVERGSWGDGSNQCPAERDPSLSSVPLRACWSSIPRCRQPVILPPPKHTRLTGGKHSRRPSSVITGEPWHSGERHATTPNWREGGGVSHFQNQFRPLTFLLSGAPKKEEQVPPAKRSSHKDTPFLRL